MRFYEYVYDKINTDTTTLSLAEMEMNVFKVYLLFNTQINLGDNTADESTRDIQYNRSQALLLAQMFQYFDITNYEFVGELYVRIVKAIELHRFLSSHKDMQSLYKKYLEYYECSDWEEVIRNTIACIKKKESGYVNLVVDVSDEKFDEKCDFIEKLVVDASIEDVDFRILRSHPIYRKK